MDAVVVGGGLIGLSVAYYLAKAGASVTVVDRHDIEGKASPAGAGMLAPLAEGTPPGPRLHFAIASLKMYPQFSRELKELTGIDPELTSSGILRVAWTDEEATLLKSQVDLYRNMGLQVEIVEDAMLHSMEPQLSGEISFGVFSAEEAHVHTQRLLQALRKAGHILGISLKEASQVVSLMSSGGRVEGVVLADGTKVAADATVVAAGCWSGGVLASAGFSLKTEPVKGQIVELYAPEVQLHTVVFSHRGYIVPRRDGSFLVGATEELEGFRAEPTAGGIGSVLSNGVQLIPRLASATLYHLRTGFRPAVTDRVPVIGPWPGIDGLYVATGHYRNGILLAPATGFAMAEVITKGRSDLDLSPFSVARFG